MGIPNHLALVEYQRNAMRIKVGGKIGSLPLLIPPPDIRNKTTHYQAIQLIDRFSVLLFSFAVGVSHGDDLNA